MRVGEQLSMRVGEYESQIGVIHGFNSPVDILWGPNLTKFLLLSGTPRSDNEDIIFC